MNTTRKIARWLRDGIVRWSVLLLYGMIIYAGVVTLPHMGRVAWIDALVPWFYLTVALDAILVVWKLLERGDQMKYVIGILFILAWIATAASLTFNASLNKMIAIIPMGMGFAALTLFLTYVIVYVAYKQTSASPTTEMPDTQTVR